MALSPPKSGPELLDLYYHDMRSHLLEVAAALDRIERAGGATDDPRLSRLRAAGRLALGEDADRARRFLEHLSV
ncbi:MAG: hypothetical protein GXP31_00390 [Kiritimatiellaeota bacterium]|nr:hypothetical protein [Kiritimatiellota bacterium]